MKRYALIVANSEFNAPKLAQLVNPGRDSKLLAEVLEDETLGGFEVTTCFNRSCAAVLEEIEGLFRRKQEDDILLLYYAGHGIKDDFGDLFYACRNTKMHRFRSSSVSAAFIRSELEKCKALRKLVILDCWYCGMFDETNVQDALGTQAGTRMAFNAEREGQAIITASDSIHYGWEQDELIGKTEHSAFTQYLVEGLINGAAARDNESDILLDDILDYVQQHFDNSEVKRESPQKWQGAMEGPIIIAKNANARASSTTPEIEENVIEVEPQPPKETFILPLAPIDAQKPAENQETEETSQIVQQLQDSLLTTSYSNTIGIEFVLIKPGSFDMGTDDGDGDEKPMHRVIIDTPFYFGKYPVTQTHWESVMGNNPSRFQGSNNPVETVSFDDVNEFINRLNDLEGTNQYRLPTEEEWEYACRAGTTTPFSSGDMITTDQANFNGDHPYGDSPKGENRHQVTEVGSFPPNAWGLCDMHGNVWEWTDTYYQSYTIKLENSMDPPPATAPRVIRGGSWRNSARSCRSAKRFNITPVYRNAILGFRLLKTIEE